MGVDQVARRARYVEAHDSIMEAAAEALAEKPFATIGEIARRAGTHRSTVYRHFPQREDLILALYQRYVEAVTEELEAVVRAGRLDRERFAACTRELAELAKQWRPHSWAPTFHRGLEQAANRCRRAGGAVIEMASASPGVLRSDLSHDHAYRLWIAPLVYASDPATDPETVAMLMLKAVTPVTAA